jgi:hypothetical protein
MRVRLDQLTSRGDQIRIYYRAVNRTLQLHAGAIAERVMNDNNAAPSKELHGNVPLRCRRRYQAKSLRPCGQQGQNMSMRLRNSRFLCWQ